jgi:hypothetical protein
VFVRINCSLGHEKALVDEIVRLAKRASLYGMCHLLEVSGEGLRFVVGSVSDPSRDPRAVGTSCLVYSISSVGDVHGDIPYASSARDVSLLKCLYVS